MATTAAVPTLVFTCLHFPLWLRFVTDNGNGIDLEPMRNFSFLYGAYDQCQRRRTTTAKATNVFTVAICHTLPVSLSLSRSLAVSLSWPFFSGVVAEMLCHAMSYLLHLPVSVPVPVSGSARRCCQCCLPSCKFNYSTLARASHSAGKNFAYYALIESFSSRNCKTIL